MAKSSLIETRHSANKSWVELCDDENSNSSVDENAESKNNIEVDKIKKDSYNTEINIKKECDDEHTPSKVSEVIKHEIKTEQEIKNEDSPWRFSYATALKNSANKSNISVTPRTPIKQEVSPEVVVAVSEETTVKAVKREIQRDFLQDDLSLTSHLDVFHMQSPLKLEPLDEEMTSPTKEMRVAKKRFCQSKLSLDEDAVMSDDLLMPSPKKVTRLSSRRKREPGESPLTCKRSKHNTSGVHNTPRCVVPVVSPQVEIETDEQILLRRQKQIDYGKNTIGYERYCQMVPKQKRHKKHPQTPPKHMKYSRRGWDGLIKQWRQQLHFWDPPSEGGGNIDDLDISSMSEASSDTTSLTSSLPATPRDERKTRRYSQITRSSASESSSVADEPCSPLKDD